MRKLGWPLLLAAAGALLLSTAWAASGGPVLTWSPTTSAGTYDYGVVTVGGGIAQTFALQNTGNKASGQLAIALTGSAFQKTIDTCTGVNLAAAKTCTVTVKYAAAKPSSGDQGSLTASSNKVMMASLALRGVTRAATPTISTTPLPAGGPLGTPLQDTASLSRGFTPSGSIVFALYPTSDCSGPSAYRESVPVNGNGTYSTAAYRATNAGGYQWTATYSGDANNTSATSGCGAEPVTIPKAGPALSSAPNPGSGPIGTGLRDTATLTNGFAATGSIQFALYPTADCSGSPVYQESVPVNGNGGYSTSTDYPATVPGSYQWTAHYSGDANNRFVDAPCGQEPVTVTAAAVSLATTPVPGAAQVGAQLSDSATLSGGVNPTGSITYQLYPTLDCSGPPVFTGHSSVAGNGPYQPNDGPFQVTAPGLYQWTAAYSGDANNASAGTSCGAEPVNVTPAATMLSTTPVPPGAPAGTALQDKASLSGGFSPSGSIIFTLYATSNCSGGPVDQETVTVSGDGSYVTPVGYASAAAGNYQWAAHYSGDGNNTPADSSCGNEPVTVDQAHPALTTSPQPASGLTGTVLQDSATLANGYAPGGSITFSLYAGSDCTSAPVAQENVRVGGNGSYSTSAGYQANVPGTYQWTATYSGDGNNAQAASACGQEPVSVTGVASPSLATSAGAGGGVGTVLHDTATLAGGASPTGTIVFTLYPTADCSGGSVFQTSVTVNGNGPYTSQPGYTTTSGGTYQWVASYGGDGNNLPAATHCGDEPVTITGLSISTTPTPAFANVGDLITDTAVLSGGVAPNSAILFALYTRPDCTQMVFSGRAPVNGNGSYQPQNGPYLVVAPGTYFWTAAYNGDANNPKVSSPCGAETVTVAPAATALSTTPNPGSGPVGGLLQDTASLSSGYQPSGSITFSLYATADCSGSPLRQETVPVSGNGSYHTSAGYTTTAVGSYQWTATYGGDANNAPATSTCGSEQVTVGPATPTLATTPNPSSGLTGTVLQDGATLAGGFSPTGSIVFTLYSTSDCSGAPLDQETVPVNGNGSYSTATGYPATAPGTYQWTASYTGDNANNAAGPAACGQEPVTVTAPIRNVYWTSPNLNLIGTANTDGSNVNQSFITGGVKKAKGIAVDGHFVYWANSASNSIGRANLDGSSPNASFIAGVPQPVSVAVAGGFIYWSWSNGGQAGAIGRASLDGTGVNPTFISVTGSPQGIAVDANYIYWADSSGQTIGRANLDGSSPNPSFIPSAFVTAPVGVAVNAGGIFWTNSTSNTIGRANLDGTNPVAGFIASGVSSPQSIAVDSKYLYWADAGTSAIVRVNLDGTSPLGIPTGSPPFGVAVDAG